MTKVLGQMVRLRHRDRAEEVLRDYGVLPKAQHGPPEPEDELEPLPAIGPAFETIDGQALRHELTQVYAEATLLRLPERLFARYPSAFRSNLAQLQSLRRRVDALLGGEDPLPDAARHLVEDLPLQVLPPFTAALARLSPEQRVVAVEDGLTSIEGLLAEPARLSETMIAALASLLRSAARAGSAAIGQQLADYAELLRACNSSAARTTVATTVTQAMEWFSKEADFQRADKAYDALVRIVAGAVIDLERGAAELADGVIAQVDVPVSDEPREKLAERAGVQAGLLDQLAASGQRYLDRQMVVDPARAQVRRAYAEKVSHSLSLEAKILWFNELEKADPMGGLFEPLAHLHLALLSQRGLMLPTAEQLTEVTAAVRDLARSPLVSTEAIRELGDQLAKVQTPRNLIATLNILKALLQVAERERRAPFSPEALAALGVSLLGKGKTFADAAAQSVLAPVLGLGEGDARTLLCRSAAQFARAIHQAEEGRTKTSERAHLPDDLLLAANEGVDLEIVATVYPFIPTDALPRLITAGFAHEEEADGWLATLNEAFYLVRGQTDSQRALRSLLVLSQGVGADVPRLLQALLAACPREKDLLRAVNAILQENNHHLSRDRLAQVIGQLERKEDVAAGIDGRLRGQMVERLGLQAILRDANVRVTAQGMRQIEGPLGHFFAQGAGHHANINQELLRKMLVSVLEDRFQQFRFTTPATARQLRCLSAAQRQAWRASQTMTHVRFQADGELRFAERVRRANALGGQVHRLLEEAWGPAHLMKARHAQVVDALRAIPKNEVEARRGLIDGVADLPLKISALEWANKLSRLTPETTTPLQFIKLAEGAQRFRDVVGEPAFNELLWTIRIDDLPFREVVTNDGPGLETLWRVSTTNCLNWPSPDVMAYAVDANKRLILTRTEQGEARRSIVRLVERQDAGHQGRPMLVLERTYPDHATQEEKQRIIEHVLRRATEMGVPAAFPLEYYWDSSQTGRRIADMNEVIRDLDRRYGTASEKKTLTVLSRGGNNATEYIDSAPPNGAAGAGQVGIRRYPGNVDKLYENKFIVLTPRRLA